MEFKRVASDFEVSEIIQIPELQEGQERDVSNRRFFLYECEKQGISTVEAKFEIAKRWHVHPTSIQFCGLKDKKSKTLQYFSLSKHHSRPFDFEIANQHFTINVRFHSDIQRHITSEDLKANQFQIILRNIPKGEAQKLENDLQAILSLGVLPNYFDDQRFGSYCKFENSSEQQSFLQQHHPHQNNKKLSNNNDVNDDDGGWNEEVNGEKKWIAKLMIEGKYEEGLKYALTEASPSDSILHSKCKTIVRNHWNRWDVCISQLSEFPKAFFVNECLNIARYLHSINQSPTSTSTSSSSSSPVIGERDYLEAFVKLEHKSLYMSAYQSYLWNECLSRHLTGYFPSNQLMHGTIINKVAFPKPPISLPIPHCKIAYLSPRMPSSPSSLSPIYRSVIEDEGFTSWKELKVRRHERKLFFSKGERDAFCAVSEVRHSFHADRLNHGKVLLKVRFQLPRSSYASIFVKHLSLFSRVPFF